MSWLHNITEKITDVTNQISIPQFTSEEIASLKNEVEILKTENIQLEKSLEELDQQHSENLQQLIKSKDEINQKNQLLEKTILDLKAEASLIKEPTNGDSTIHSRDNETLITKLKNLEVENFKLKNINEGLCEKIDANVCDLAAYKLLLKSNEELLQDYAALKKSNSKLQKDLETCSNKCEQITATFEEKKHQYLKEIYSLKEHNSKLLIESSFNDHKYNNLLKFQEELSSNNKLLEENYNSLNEKLKISSEYFTDIKILENKNTALQESILKITKELDLVNLQYNNEMVKKEKLLYDNSFNIDLLAKLNDKITILSDQNIELHNKTTEIFNQNLILQKDLVQKEQNLQILIEEKESLFVSNQVLLSEMFTQKSLISELEINQKDSNHDQIFAENLKAKADLDQEIIKHNILNSELRESSSINDNKLAYIQMENNQLMLENNKLRQSLTETDEKYENIKQKIVNSVEKNDLGKTDTEKVLENKVEDLTASLVEFQEKYNQLWNKQSVSNNENLIEKSLTQLEDVNLLTQLKDENITLKTNLDELKEEKFLLETNYTSSIQQLEVDINNVRTDYEHKIFELNNNLTVSNMELEKTRNVNRQKENKINNIANDYTLILEKLSKINLENKDIISKTVNINNLIVKLFDTLKIEKPNKSEYPIQYILEKNCSTLFEYVQNNFRDLEKLRGAESERDNLRTILQNMTLEHNIFSEKFEETSKQLFVLQQQLSCSRSEILTTTEEHKKVITELNVKHQTDISGLNTAINDLSAKNMKLQSQLDSFKAEYESKYSTNLQDNYSLQQKLEDSVKKMVQLEEDKMLLEGKYEEVNDELTRINNTDEAAIVENNKMMKEIARLKNHLVEMEDLHMKEIVELSVREEILTNQVQQLESQLAFFNNAVKTEKINKSMLHDQMEAKLKDALIDLESFKKKCLDQEKNINDYKTSTLNLQSVLEEFQKNSTSHEMIELEKTKKLLISEATANEDLTKRCIELEEMVNILKDKEASTLKVINDLKKSMDEVLALKQTISIKEELIFSLESRLSSIKIDKESKIDKLIMKNLILGYFHTPSAKKSEVLNVLGHILDFSDEDFTLLHSKDSSRWIDRVLFSDSQQSQNQSFMELFVKFLEKESTPRHIIPMSADPDRANGDLNRSNSLTRSSPRTVAINNNQSENAALSRYLASLQQQQRVSEKAMGVVGRDDKHGFVLGHERETEIEHDNKVVDDNMHDRRNLGQQIKYNDDVGDK